MSDCAPAEDVATLLTRLIEVPSVNPRDSTVAAETPLARYIAELCEGIGLQVRLDEVLDGRCNVVAVLPGRTREYVVLESHLDTVETEGMTVPAFTPQRDGDRIYGRGACDAKGSLAAFLTALATLVSDEHPPRRGVVLAGVIDEEHRYRGVSDLLDRGLLRDPGAELTGAIVGEPTELSLVVAHKGCMRCRITATGPGGHSSLPWGAVNPIETLAEVVDYLRETNTWLGRQQHSLVGPPSVATTLISGGSGPNMLPETAELTIDRRTVAGEEPEEVWQQIRDDVQDRWPDLVNVAPPHVVDFALDTTHQHGSDRFLRMVGRQLSAAGLDPTGVGVGHGSDASKLARAGVPSVVFGPGSMAQAHTRAEYVEIKQLQHAVTVLTGLLREEQE